MLSCEECKHDRCVLFPIMEYMGSAWREQYDGYREGDPDLSYRLEALYHLHRAVRMCVCPQTQTLPPNMLPDIQGDLRVLPPAVRKVVRYYVGRAWMRETQEIQK